MKVSRRSIVAFAAGAVTLLFAPAISAAQSAGKEPLPARSVDGGGVRVLVKPKGVVIGSPWEFEVTMDTHSKPLTEDLTKTTVLIDDNENRYTPLAWQGDPPGGHHRKGVLRFLSPAKQPKSFEIQIQGVGGVSKRTFQWTLK